MTIFDEILNGIKTSGEKIEKARVNPCETADFPWCNGAEGCDSCEHQEEE